MTAKLLQHSKPVPRIEYFHVHRGWTYWFILPNDEDDPQPYLDATKFSKSSGLCKDEIALVQRVLGINLPVVLIGE